MLILRVSLLKIANVPPLPPSDANSRKWGGGKRDPYVVLQIDDNEHTSASVPRTLNPSWSPPAIFDFNLPLHDPRLLLRVSVLDYLNHDLVVASTELPIPHMSDDDASPTSHRLRSHVPGSQAKCHIWLSMAWIEDGPPPSGSPMWEYQRLGDVWEADDGNTSGCQLNFPGGDADGWEYADSVDGPWSIRQSPSATARRRRWLSADHDDDPNNGSSSTS
ncbi:Aste57867_23415 [Aphanomyces stellatus]|uniref:Aste57867_23415 protein n=1 Tax=Aphanomyces stellatus TaxID=120398 RepID=A0A485LNG1_9STRA|nr:hypothetical protein As57867_023344 [Aphanomyces stellatus]VFU00061.1 Aste57867_23415 [Aphanomyces stellatus]